MKIGQLYNLDKFKAFKDSAKQSGFTDSDAGVILSRFLTAVNPRLFEKKYPELAFVNSGIQANNIGGYARRIQSLRLIDRGDFADTDDQDTNKGLISLTAEDNYLRVYPKTAHSIWTDDDIKEAELAHINLVERYVATHNKVYLQTVDKIGFLGHDGQAGLLNNAGFAVTAASGKAETLKGADLYNEIASLIIDQRSGVNNTPEYSADTVVMPIRAMNVLAGTLLNANAYTSKSVLAALQDNFPDVKFIATFRAENVNGASATVAFATDDNSMVMRIPVPLTIGEIVNTSSFTYRVDSKFRIGGLDVLENAAGRILTGL